MEGGALAAGAVGFVREGVDAGGVDPAVIEVEEGTDGDGVVDLLVGPAGGVEGYHVGGGDGMGGGVDLVEEAEEGFLGGGKGGGFEVGEDGLDGFFTAKEDRRDRGVGLDSEGAMVAGGGEGGDEFAEAGGEGRLAVEDLVGELGEVLGGLRLEGKEVPDLGVFGTAFGHGGDGLGIGAGCGIGFDVG